MFEKNIHTYTIKEQVTMHKSRVAIVGIGGGGCIVAEILARVGIGNIILIDGDKFEDSNLNRQIGCLRHTIGSYKTDVIKNRILEINPLISVQSFPTFLNKENSKDLLRKVDIVCDTVDGVENKIMLSNYCKDIQIPFVTGGVGGYNLWTATMINKSSSDIFKNKSKSLFANAASVFIQGGLQAQEIINFLLKRDWNANDKQIVFNHNLYTMVMRDIK